ncbi:MAG: sigma-E factor negative regulatory protein [Gammaproteobacteria bacterium]
MKHRDEHLSAFLDDELDGLELRDFMQDLKRSPVTDAEQLQRYQMIRDVLNDELNQSSFIDISAAVHRTIEQEADAVIEQYPRRKSTSLINLSAWLRPLSGLAIAASVAMVTVVTVRVVSHDATETVQPLVAESQINLPVAPVEYMAPVNNELLQRIHVVSTEDLEKQSRIREQQLREYMMNHSEYAGQTTIQGMMPYARVVSFNPQAKK